MSRLVIHSVAALRHCLKSRRGQSLVEYALMLSFVSLSSVAIISVLGIQIRAIYLPIIHVLEAIRAAI